MLDKTCENRQVAFTQGSGVSICRLGTPAPLLRSIWHAKDAHRNRSGFRGTLGTRAIRTVSWRVMRRAFAPDKASHRASAGVSRLVWMEAVTVTLRQAKKIMDSDWTGRNEKQVWRAHVRVRRTESYKSTRPIVMWLSDNRQETVQ